MKRISTILALLLALCLLLSAGAFASGEPSGDPSGEASGGGAIAPGVYTNGERTLVIAEDLTFTMDKTGENMEGEAFVLTVTGHVEDGAFVLDGLFDGDINLIEVASEEQIAGDLATVEEVYAAAAASGEPAGDADFVLNGDGTFVLYKTGQNMEGAEFLLKVTGHVEADGSVVLEGLFDGDINLIDLATEEQIAADTASVQAALAG